jgi:hypothetical protein
MLSNVHGNKKHSGCLLCRKVKKKSQQRLRLIKDFKMTFVKSSSEMLQHQRRKM